MEDVMIVWISGPDSTHAVRIPVRSCHEWLGNMVDMRYIRSG